jgi:hypothetical protein
MHKKSNKRIILINFCIAAILAIIAGSLAAYTSLSSAKRVVSTMGTSQLFSSNVLNTYETTPSMRTMTFSQDGDTNTFTFTVCNYAQGDKTTWASQNITYDLTVTLLDLDGNEVTKDDILSAYTIDGQSFSNLSNHKITNQVLEKKSNEATENIHTITIPVAYMDSYRICIIATSEGYDALGRIISASETQASTHWTGTFTDGIVDDANHKPAELASINTRIYGQEHELMVITWDSEYVDIDPWFLEDIGAGNYTITEDSTKKTKKLSFEVGGDSQPSQYDIIFYRTQSAKTLNESWEKMKGHITFTYSSLPIETTQDGQTTTQTESTTD